MGGHDPALKSVKDQIRRDREPGGGQRTLEYQTRIIQGESGHDRLAKPARADKGRQSRRADSDDRRDPHAGEEPRQGQGQFNAPQTLGTGQPHARRNFDQQRLDRLQGRNRGAQNRQDRIQQETGHRRPQRQCRIAES